jgi:hypothetical protein
LVDGEQLRCTSVEWTPLAHALPGRAGAGGRADVGDSEEIAPPSVNVAPGGSTALAFAGAGARRAGRTSPPRVPTRPASLQRVRPAERRPCRSASAQRTSSVSMTCPGTADGFVQRRPLAIASGAAARHSWRSAKSRSTSAWARRAQRSGHPRRREGGDGQAAEPGRPADQGGDLAAPGAAAARA